jgi:pilus assembly protein CpaC
MDNTTFRSIALAGIGALALALTLPAAAQSPTEQVVRAGRSTSFTVPIYRSRIIELTAPAKRVSIGNPDIADVLILKSNELYVLGKDLGTTNVLLWDRDDVLISSLTVAVTHDLEGLKRQIASVLGDERIEVYSAQRNVVLAGSVTSAVKMAAAVQLAESYLEEAATAKEKIFFKQEARGEAQERKAGKVINLMSVSGSQQVMLQVKVAEMQRSLTRRMDAQLSTLTNHNGKWVFGGVNGGATFPDAKFEPNDVRIPVFGNGTHAGGNPIGPVFDEFAPSTASIQDTGVFMSFLSNDFLANLVLDVAKERGLAKILAEPTLTTLTGQEAKFLSGGSFPIPVASQNGITVDFKEFGVALNFLPVILDGGRINLKINISVSELVDSNSLAVAPVTTSGIASGFFAIPALTERKAISTVELGDGQTIGIAGLINENLREAVQKFPGLGDIPVLGQLFRSQSFQKGETELVILVTPKLAKPLNPGDIKLPTDSLVEPSDLEFYLLGRLEGRASSAPAASTSKTDGTSPASAPPAVVAGDEPPLTGGATGTFGHSIDELPRD